MNKRVKPIDPLQKRIPTNPKFVNVQPTIDTGCSMSNYHRKMEQIRQNYRIRPNELFKRMKISTFVQLVLQVAELKHFDLEAKAMQRAESASRRNADNDGDGDGDDNDDGDDDGGGDDGGDDDGRGDDATGRRDTDMLAAMHKPYLLLDVRDPDEFHAQHIVGAVNYPYFMTSRSMNFEIDVLRQYRNRPGCIILVYDADERIAPNVATFLVQRGYENLFLLSGGLNVARKIFPSGSLMSPASNSASSSVAAAAAAASSQRGAVNQNRYATQQQQQQQRDEEAEELTEERLAQLKRDLDQNEDATSTLSRMSSRGGGSAGDRSTIFSVTTTTSSRASRFAGSTAASAAASVLSSAVNHPKPFK